MTKNFDVRRFNTREHKVHLDHGWEGENLSFLEMAAYGESKGTGEGDTPPIDDQSYDFIEELSKVRYAPAD